MGGAVRIVANSPRSRALGFGATSQLPPVSCADPSKVGVALPRVLPASENRSGQNPMLYVQLRIGPTILPALVDSGACDNFFSEQAVAEMHIEPRPLRRTTRILSANGKSMECASHVVVTAVLGALSFQLSLRVIPSSVRVILCFHFLQHFDPRIFWRRGTLAIVCGTGRWSVPTCPTTRCSSQH